MTTVYPGALDSLSNPTTTSATSNPSHAGQHTDGNDAIEAIEAELGVTPSGAAATVAARFTADEAGLANHLSDTAAAHAASAISILDTAGDFTATEVEGALAELQADAEAHIGADPHTIYQKESEKAAASGYASLDSGVMVPVAQIRSVNAGTSFPGSPTSNDMFYRTDRDILYSWDGTRWLSVTLYTQTFPYMRAVNPLAASTTFDSPHPHLTYSIWVETFFAHTWVNTTNDGSKYWTLTGPNAVVLSTVSNAADSWIMESATVDAVIAQTSGGNACVNTKVSTAGTAFLLPAFTYRFIG